MNLLDKSMWLEKTQTRISSITRNGIPRVTLKIRKMQYLEVDFDAIDEKENDNDEHQNRITSIEYVGKESLQQTKNLSSVNVGNATSA